ncbi:hypothetical protein SARC_08330 [Sphaeroforma arctica JP610]|uniref:Uncharacterized protein n=1 Tax=Sphaeroforma arctica JP610 TaxID=667725 RepID=A0A0L0FTJ4_9EUKA|nr:hypothetical protein SARC_08330 [Sphaeroforma arctica JP610]KNC79268.1 hypothetical protein SARC_08330 [Sphaeroforma arctica JP610]|eukprot:XP_014153170.1 hypothetical protein SARC_08330 [Sphaeroforma arctica JP610]
MSSTTKENVHHTLAYKVWKLCKAGERLTAIDMAIAVVVSCVLFSLPSIHELFMWNALCQLILFTVVVEIPCLLTSHMCYVDLGWPAGLVVLGLNCLIYGQGWWLRKLLVCTCMIFHGGRMLAGGLVMFYPYRFKNDLSRYQYARVRWVDHEKLPESWWVLKMLQETLSQSFANIVVLASPLLIATANTSKSLMFLEVLGVAWWCISWFFESYADVQKQLFLTDCRTQRKTATPEQKAVLKQAVLGYAPFDTPKYSLWTLSRHPNYLGELSCWFAFALMGLPTVLDYKTWMPQNEHWSVPFLLVGLWLVVRFFYDCLVYWTGAQPAEAGSVTRRPTYKEYQKVVPVMFPKAIHMLVPFADHHMTPGWPVVEDAKTE